MYLFCKIQISVLSDYLEFKLASLCIKEMSIVKKKYAGRLFDRGHFDRMLYRHLRYCVNATEPKH